MDETWGLDTQKKVMLFLLSFPPFLSSFPSHLKKKL